MISTEQSEYNRTTDAAQQVDEQFTQTNQMQITQRRIDDSFTVL